MQRVGCGAGATSYGQGATGIGPRLMGVASHLVHEWGQGASVCEPGGAVRLAADFVLYRAMAFGHLPCENREHAIQLRSGRRVEYRLNRGDLQSIREVLLDKAYRLPFSMSPRVVVDLGANIGLTSLWLTMRYHPDMVLAVEPDPDNAMLARRNLEPLGATVVEAAVGPVDGRAHFRRARASNLGAVVSAEEADGASVDMLSIPTLLDTHGIGTVDLMKLDIEGGERALLDGDVTWLSRVRSLIVEFHPTIVDYERLVKRVESQGFRYLPAGSAWQGSMDAFVRSSSMGETA